MSAINKLLSKPSGAETLMEKNLRDFTLDDSFGGISSII